MQVIKNAPPVMTKQFNGKIYTAFTDGSEGTFTLIPTISGYKSVDRRDRILVTDSHQLTVDFEKAIQISDNIESDLYYGAIFSSSTKTMVHKYRRYLEDLQPWLEVTFDIGENCETLREGKKENLYLCPTKYEDTSLLIPVERTNSAAYLKNNYYFNEFLTVDVGVRLDKVNYYPKFNDKAGVKAIETILHKIEDKSNNLGLRIPDMTKKRSMIGKSYAVKGTFNLINGISITTKYASAFRAPTIDELYFAYTSKQAEGIFVLPSPDLNPEVAKNIEFSITAENEFGFAQLSSFSTKYDEFINFKMIDKIRESYIGEDYHGVIRKRIRQVEIYQNSNAEKAQIYGIEFKGRIALSNLPIKKFKNYLQGVELGYNYSQQKGIIEGKPLNTINPPSSTFDISYTSNNDKFKVNLYIKHVKEKKAEDTVNYMYNPDNPDSLPYAKFRSKTYTTVDLTTQIKPLKGLTIQAGVYNLFNEKYITWNSIKFVTTDKISNKFTAPSRNYRLSIEYEF